MRLFLSIAAALACSAAPAVLVTPRSPAAGDTLGVLATSGGQSLDGATIELTGPSGAPVAAAWTRGGGVAPSWRAARFEVAAKGEYVASLKRGGETLATAVAQVGAARAPRAAGAGVWATESGWGCAAEGLYAAWVDLLFADADEGASWGALHEVTRDAGRNFLHGHLGLGEDGHGGAGGLAMKPDCADNPFFLRAYFAWKLGLPFGMRQCTRGTPAKGPACKGWITNESPPAAAGKEGGAFALFLKKIMNTIHSGSARTQLDDEATDLYPVALSREAIRPGVVFADPYGHTLTVARWVPQAPGAPGKLLAVDAQPDGTVGVKRFWRGTFLFETGGVSGGPGFKAFRPIVRPAGGALHALANAELGAGAGFNAFSLEQQGMGKDDFYDRVERLVNPDPLDPVSASTDLHEAVLEQLLVRVASVAIGEAYMASTKGKVVPMPDGAAIFQTTGPWEDYATPSRDMRLLIAMDVVLDFPAKVARLPGAFVLPEGTTPEAMKGKLAQLHDEWCAAHSIAYTRSDGSQQTVTVAQLFERMEAFEAAYNPNDCVEVRWGAPAKSAEIAACKRHAPKDQQKKMKEYRAWFHERKRPLT